MPISRRELLQASASVAALGGASSQSTPSIAATTPETRKSKVSSGKKPNIAIIVLDDVGFSDLGCYGSDIDTSCIDGLAQNGTRFNNFHVTALCAPTRACLMTGRNAHAVGVGNIAEWGRPLPGYKGYIRDDVKLLPQMMGDAGYSTIAVGKWHLSMVNDQDAMGPFDYWPIQRGFDHWYGFHGSAVDHWHPELFRNTAAVYPDKSDGYHLTEDLIDQSINYVADHLVASPDRPFFLYLGLGACHFPFHAPKDYMEKYRGKFDAGWDALRRPRLEKQKDIGIAPEGAELSPSGSNIEAWDDISDDERRFSARTQEAYAAMLDHTDDHLQRFVDFLRREGQLDDTIILVMSDNGAGKQDSIGSLDVRRVSYIGPESLDEMVKRIDKIGTEESSSYYAAGWGQLGNTPLKYHKGDTFEGGIRAPLVVHWPNGSIPTGKVSSQYHHVTDLTPTLLDLIGGQASEENHNLAETFDGLSMAYCLEDPNAPTRKTVQHYETAGDRAIWADGWKAVTLHQFGDEFEDDKWALYHAAEDFAEIRDLSEQEPERLKELIDLWYAEAERNDVLPLDDDLDGLYAKIAPKPRERYVFYPGATRLNRIGAPDIHEFDYTISADVDLSNSNANGVLLASGDSMAGYELILRDGYLEYTYVYTREHRYDVKARKRVGKGQHVIGLRGKKTGKHAGQVDLFIDDDVVGQLELPKMWEIRALNAGVRCGQNRGAPISFSYKGPFEFDQQLEKVVVSLAL